MPRTLHPLITSAQAMFAIRFLVAAILALAVVGCTIQDVFRSTLGGVNSDQASLNKVNPMNDQSFPQDENRTVWKFPGAQ